MPIAKNETNSWSVPTSQTDQTSATNQSRNCSPSDSQEPNPKERFFMDRMADASCELRKIKVVVTDGQVELQGTVASYYQKQLAQETIRRFVIGSQIVNNIIVAD